MSDSTQILLCGLGGQGIVLAGTILGQAAVNEGKWAAGANAYGSQARGGNARSEIVISSESIIYPRVMVPDILIAFTQSTYDADLTRLNDEKALVIYDQELVNTRQRENTKQTAIPATQISMDLVGNNQSANMVMLGALVGINSVISLKSLNQSVKEYSASEFLEQNLSAVKAGYDYAAKISRS